MGRKKKNEKRRDKSTNKNNPHQNGSDYFCLVQEMGVEPTRLLRVTGT